MVHLTMPFPPCYSRDSQRSDSGSRGHGEAAHHSEDDVSHINPCGRGGKGSHAILRIALLLEMGQGFPTVLTLTSWECEESCWCLHKPLWKKIMTRSYFHFHGRKSEVASDHSFVTDKTWGLTSPVEASEGLSTPPEVSTSTGGKLPLCPWQQLDPGDHSAAFPLSPPVSRVVGRNMGASPIEYNET